LFPYLRKFVAPFAVKVCYNSGAKTSTAVIATMNKRSHNPRSTFQGPFWLARAFFASR
jgi:hypothetical protein